MENFKLDEHPKISSGFREPAGYFESLSASVMAKINAEQPKVIPLYKRYKIIWCAAAAVVFAALMIPVINDFTPKEAQPDAVSIENYLTYQSNISTDDIASLLNEEDLDNIDSDISLDDKSIEEVLTSDNNFENLID
ncbi:hypothetical protein [Flavobacterium pallidum]|uniref:Uncharacterized protein n=1 Tax=Flavobacterium pallidum TaxID=2172098 RepID=A0A2S1SJV3_9FLAO|nr:hypothetical protein [Flavobacterium pallidum]AWI26665.1 hypothetical protein HYN49_12580 [Flavobacterium pallidum]